MHEILGYALSHTPALIMYLIGTGVLIWTVYMSYKMAENQFGVDQSVYLPYCLYTFFIACWIFANAYFQSELLTYYDSDVAWYMAIGANIFCAFAILSAYWFSCKLISKSKTRKISRLQLALLVGLSLHSLIVNIIPGMTVISVETRAAGEFLIRFGDYNTIFFLTAPFIICLTFINFLRAWKSELRLTQLKSGYMMGGVILFMVSTLIVMIFIPYFFDDFSLVWVAPTLSVFEMTLIGYALLCNRFYSGRYITLVGVSSLTNIAIFLAPALIITDFGGHQNIALLCWIVITGLFYQKLFKKVYWFFNQFLYGKAGNSIDQLVSLESEFRFSCDDAVDKLNQTLGVKRGYIRKVLTDKDALLLDFFAKGERIIVKEELEYILDNHMGGRDKIAEIVGFISANNVSLVLPIFGSRKEVTHFYLARQSKQHPLITADQEVGLHALFNEASRWIIAEEKVRKSQIIAGSIAHEIRNPFSKLKYHFDQIDTKVLGKESIDLGNQSSEEIKELHQALNESKRAVLSGTRFIDAMLAEIRGDTLKSELFSLHSASELTISAINDFSFNKPENRQRVSLTLEDFVFWGDDTLFSFVIFNLLKNATYYFEQYPESKIDIKLSRGKTANTLLVTDYGPGIPESNLPHLFDDLFTDGKDSGTGLGLAYCKRVMEAFKGNISCTSQQGVYATFKLSFPLVDDSEFEAELRSSLQPHLSNKLALVVSPAAQQRPLDPYFNDAFDVSVHYSQNSDQATGQIETSAVDFVLISDCEPSTASEIANAVRSNVQGSELPILYCRSYFHEELSPSDNVFDAALSVSSKHSFWRSFVKACEAGALKKKVSLTGKKVLVVDDTHVNRLLVQSYLVLEGVDVHLAASGVEAIEKAKQTAFDLIFMDIRMPNMNGFEACEEIRKFCRSVPIISLSGESGPDARQSIDELMDDYIPKPAEKKQLVSMIRKWCDEDCSTDNQKPSASMVIGQ